MTTTLALQQDRSWQDIMTSLVTDPAELLEILGLDVATLPAGHPLLTRFPLRVPAPWLQRIERGNPLDPLLLQVLPLQAEADTVPGFTSDPLDEHVANKVPGLLHKYRGRALLLPTSSCPVHCRYCFRRHFPYADNNPGKQQWRTTLDYLARDKSLREVILSGGDPLTLPDNYLSWFLDELAAIPHIRRIRIHTRMPVMVPQRITRGLCRLLANPRFRTILVIHSNHFREFDTAVDRACADLKQAGVLLLNQSVLLRQVNDDAAVLAGLSERLFDAGVQPYYLHLLDRVQGAAHFDIPETRARALVRELRQLLPGYLVPALVRETAGEGSKTLLA